MDIKKLISENKPSALVFALALVVLAYSVLKEDSVTPPAAETQISIASAAVVEDHLSSFTPVAYDSVPALSPADGEFIEVQSKPLPPLESLSFVAGIMRVSDDKYTAYPVAAQGDVSSIELFVDMPMRVDLGSMAFIHAYPKTKDSHAKSLSIHWSLVRKPQNSNATLMSDYGNVIEFKPDVPGVYVLGVVMDAQAGVMPITQEVFTAVLVR